MQNKRELIVIKFGSESLVNSQGIDQGRINSHAKRLKPLHREHDLLVVTSGAVAWAKRRLERMGKDWRMYSARSLAMLGSAGIAVAWEHAFEAAGLTAGQVLASHHEVRDDSFEAANFIAAYEMARRDYAIPILNHNDFMAKAHSKDDELEKIEKQKDNDEFSLEIARLLSAKVLILATNHVEGFMKDNGVKHKVHTSEIESLKEYIYEISEDGTGGMGSKLDVGAMAVEAGIRAFICNADAEFAQILADEQIGTEVIQ